MPATKQYVCRPGVIRASLVEFDSKSKFRHLGESVGKLVLYGRYFIDDFHDKPIIIAVDVLLW